MPFRLLVLTKQTDQIVPLLDTGQDSVQALACSLRFLLRFLKNRKLYDCCICFKTSQCGDNGVPSVAQNMSFGPACQPQVGHNLTFASTVVGVVYLPSSMSAYC